MSCVKQTTTTLHNGYEMPNLGLGVWRMDQSETSLSAIKYALSVGYRLIDTAARYDNEAIVGQALKESDVLREDVFVTSKVWHTDHGYEKTLAALDQSLMRLQLDYLDLFLIHWPIGDYIGTWRALEEAYREGKLRAIGVSNFNQEHLIELAAVSEIKPMVNQIEYHPYLVQTELRTYCQAQGIAVQAWSPLGKGELLQDPVCLQLAEKYQKTPAQIVLRWDLQQNVLVIPKSVTPHRILENSEIFDFTLSEEDMAQLTALNRDHRFGPDPVTFQG